MSWRCIFWKQKWHQCTNGNAGTRSKEVHHTLRDNIQIWDENQPWAVAEAAYIAVSYMQLKRSSLSSYRWCCKQRANRQVMSRVQDHHQPASRLTAIKAKLHHTVRSAKLQISALWTHRFIMSHLHPNQQPAPTVLPITNPQSDYYCHTVTPSPRPTSGK